MKLSKKFAIVEDEQEYADELENYINEFFADKDISCEVIRFDSPVEFLEKYDFSFDLVFMDINLPEMDGMSAIHKLREQDKDVLVIFVTSLAQYAIKGYEVNAFDFVVKPISFYDFALKLTRTLPYLKKEKDKFIVINNKHLIRKIKVSQLSYIEITEHRLAFHLSSGEIVSAYGTMKTYIEILKDDDFALCNQSYLVNLKYVSSVQGNFVMVGKDSLLISRPKRKEFISALTAFFSDGG